MMRMTKRLGSMGMVGVLMVFLLSCSRPVAITSSDSGACVDDGQCLNGYVCSIDGYCVPEDSDDDQSGGNGGDAPDEGGACLSSNDCASGFCDLSSGSCVDCLLDEHCPIPEVCLETNQCSGSDDTIGSDDNDESPGSQEDDEDDERLQPCEPSAAREEGPTCSDGLDNDCDGQRDGYDLDCGATACGAVANWNDTDACNRDIPPNKGARVCERFPYGGSESPNLCMNVCRTSSDCEADEACYTSRRSINVHFCAPAPPTAEIDIGGACLDDYQCETGLCHDGQCRDVCVRDSDCGGSEVCRATIVTPRHLGQESATGICVEREPGLLTIGQPCSSASMCQSGACSQTYTNGPYECTKLCGSEYDCGLDERCASGLYSDDQVLGFGIRSCTDAPQQSVVGPGDYCLNGSDCSTFLCDSTYYRPDGTSLLSPYCNQHCDTDNDCPRLFPGTDANAFNLQMRCIVSSTDSIAPLIGGFCSPFWCSDDSDCINGGRCFIFNTDRLEGMPAGICE